MSEAETCFSWWAPADGIWSAWAKPVLFTQFGAVPPSLEDMGFPETDIAWAPSAAPSAKERVAIVLDLPGKISVLTGVSLAGHGYRPVPLFNCCAGMGAVVDVSSLVDALQDGAEVLSHLEIPADAPPAFLLDSRRRGGISDPAPGKFDNRWIVLPQDFPSANLMMSRGIKRALLVQEHVGQPRKDLAHVLLRWQQAGMQIDACSLQEAVQKLIVARPSMFRGLLHGMLATMGLRRSSVGGFGSVVPMPVSSGGGGFGGGFG